MTSRIKNTSIPLRFDSASISSGENERIVFPSIVFARKEVVPSQNLSTDQTFVVVSVEVQQIPADEARAGSFGYAVDIEENDPRAPRPIKVGLSLALPPSNFEDLVKRVMEIKAHPIEMVVDIDDDDEVSRLVVDGDATHIVARSSVGATVQPMQPSSAVR